MCATPIPMSIGPRYWLLHAVSIVGLPRDMAPKSTHAEVREHRLTVLEKNVCACCSCAVS